jgi:ABC-type bacteriocin/lantibiotic exporter with double-glycine peptidase domain
MAASTFDVNDVRRRRWWAPPPDDLSRSLAFGGMPASLAAFIRRVSLWSQLWICLVAVAVFVLNTVPLELQRRILNAMVYGGNIKLVLGLALAYLAVVLAEGLLKLLMNVYRGWTGEKAARALRLATSTLIGSLPPQQSGAQGVGVALILAEPDPIGEFVGIAASEVVLQAGILLSVFGYMFYLQPWLAVVTLAIFSPQLVFVPLMQRAINRRVQARVRVLRQASAGALLSGEREVEQALRQEMRFAEVFALNLGIFKLRYSMKFLMNLTQTFGKVVVLAVGGWHVITGDTQVGTVVAFVSGLHSVEDPWRDLVDWYQRMMMTRARYAVFAGAMRRFAAGEDPLAA